MSKMKQPKISVIVPIYKVEKYLVQCIDSILNQTLKDIEVILVAVLSLTITNKTTNA